MRIAWIGVGAAGGYYAAKLVRAGVDVHLLLRNDYDAVKERGLRIRSYEGDFAVEAERLNVYRSAPEMPQCDLVINTLKTTANAHVGELLAPLLHEKTVVLTLQNGLGNEQLLSRYLPAERILGGTMFTCITRPEPGVIHHQAQGHIAIAEFARTDLDRVRAIAEMFRSAGIRCAVEPSLRTLRWKKQLWNMPFNGIGAAFDLPTDALIHSKPGRELVIGVMREVLAIARADGAELSDELIKKNLDATMPMGQYFTSMHLDRLAGRPLEHEAIIGEPLRIAHHHDLRCPLLGSIYFLLRFSAEVF